MNIKGKLMWKVFYDIFWQQWITIMTLREIVKKWCHIFDRILRLHSVYCIVLSTAAKIIKPTMYRKSNTKQFLTFFKTNDSFFIILHSQTQSTVWRILEILTFIPVDKRRHRHGTWDKSEAIKHLCLYLIHAGFLP